MNSSFPNRWSFSYLKFTKYVTNIIAEPKYKYGQQEQVTSNSKEPQQKYRLGTVSIKILGGWALKPVLRDPNLDLSLCYMTRIMNNGNGNEKHKTNIYGKQGEQLLEWGGHSASLDKIKYNAEGNADSLRVATKSCNKQKL